VYDFARDWRRLTIWASIFKIESLGDDVFLEINPGSRCKENVGQVDVGVFLL
jgi:hypothetical protein